MKKRIFKGILYYIFGFMLFYITLQIIQHILLSILEISSDDIVIFMDNLKDTSIIYTIIYMILYLLIYIYDRIMVNKLNKKLEEMRKNNNE